MSLYTILLIVAAPVVVFILYRVGRSSREAPHARDTAHSALPADQEAGELAGGVRDLREEGQIDYQSRPHHAENSQGQGCGRHGCC